ncbi:MAG: hypothetical protein ACKV2T_41870 [Kofleriaceae bacterium]
MHVKNFQVVRLLLIALGFAHACTQGEERHSQSATSAVTSEGITEPEIDELDERILSFIEEWSRANTPLTVLRDMTRHMDFAIEFTAGPGTSFKSEVPPFMHTRHQVSEVASVGRDSGHASVVLSIVVAGGRIGDEGVSASHAPSFTVGARYIVMARSFEAVGSELQLNSDQQVVEVDGATMLYLSERFPSSEITPLLSLVGKGS